LIDVLREARVERIYGVIGDSLNPVVDAVRRADGIDGVTFAPKRPPRSLRRLRRSSPAGWRCASRAVVLAPTRCR
jgi:hypothetical protein